MVGRSESGGGMIGRRGDRHVRQAYQRAAYWNLPPDGKEPMADTSISANDAGQFCALSPDLHCILDPTGRFKWVSPNWGSVMGPRAAPVDGATFFDLLDEDAATTMREAIARPGDGEAAKAVARHRRDGGDEVWLEWRFAVSGDGVTYASGRDITERRRSADAVDALRILEDEAEQVAELGSWRLDLATRHLNGSPQAYRIFGVDPDAGTDLGQVAVKTVHPDDLDAVVGTFRVAMTDGALPPTQCRIVLADGRERWLDVRGRRVLDASGRAVALIGFVQDVTERKAAELESVDREQRLRAVIDNAPFGAHMYNLEPDGRLVFIGFNAKAEQMLDIDHTSLIGLTLEEAFPGLAGTETAEAYRQVARTGASWEIEQLAYEASGIAGVFEVHAFSSEPGHVSVFFRDVTWRKGAEVALRASEERFRAMFEQAGAGMAQVGSDGRWLQVNDRLCDILGYAREELLESTFIDITHPDDVAESVRQRDLMASGQADRYMVEKRYLRKDGSAVWVHLTDSAVRGEDGEARYFFAVIQDISERKRAEHALGESERFVQSILDTTPNLIYIYNIAEGHNAYANREVSGFLGYTAEEVKAFGSSLFEHILHPDDMELVAAHHAAFVTVGDGEVCEVQYRMQHAGGEWRWLHSRDVVFSRDDAGAVTEILGFCEDVTARLQVDTDLRQSNAHLEQMVYDVAEAMGRVIEVRDPYTRGHQERVARLCKAIAIEMGLPVEDVAAVELAALVHDIGKLSVPAEILCMPRELSSLEFSLIQEHPLKGFDILKDIAFPWPIAEIVFQHHERIDGSGYPRGIADGDILLSARILGVADVVEAMASHRPYRPALGLEAAVEELRACPDIYDPEVVAAVLRLHEGGRLDL